MRALRRVGFFADLDYGDAREGRLSESVAPAAADFEAEAAGYLRAGHEIAAAFGVTRDILASDRPIIGTLSILTDGAWAWPSDLAHYVERYHCRLPADFVAHMQARGWCPPQEDEFDLAALQL